MVELFIRLEDLPDYYLLNNMDCLEELVWDYKGRCFVKIMEVEENGYS